MGRTLTRSRFSTFSRSHLRLFAYTVLLALASLPLQVRAAEGAYLGPIAAAASRDGKSLFIANADGRSIAVVNLERGAPIRTISLLAEPTGLAISPDGATLYVTCGGPKGTVQVLDVGTGEKRGAIPVGHTGMGPAISPDGKRLYVCNRFDGDVSVIDLAAGREMTRVRVTREPIAAGITPDGRTVFVANHLPADPADGKLVSAVVTAIDTRTNEAVAIRLPNGSTNVRGLCVSPDGKYVYVTHILARFHLPTTQVERGWISTNALSIIDAGARTHLATVLLDDVDRGAANPWGVATTADGLLICVAHAGTGELSVIDAQALMAKVASRSVEIASSATGAGVTRRPLAVSDDLTFLTGLRRRIALHGLGPRGLAVVGDRAYACEYFTDTLGLVPLKGTVPMFEAPGSAVAFRNGDGPRQIALGPAPALTTERRGEILFNSADLCFQKWLSCASCHPDARTDGLNWDLINDGLGNPKNTRSMLLAHKTPPAMASGIRPTAEEAVRAGIKHILFTEQSETDAAAIDAYLESLQPVPSPYRVASGPGEAVRRGEQLFFDPKVGCGACHPVPRYTDLKPYDVRSRGAYDRSPTFDTPTLIECWRTAPYMHDGRYPTLRALLKDGKHGETHGSELTPEQIENLVAFMMSL